MNDTHSPLISGSATTSYQITQSINTGILILNLTTVYQYIIDHIDELHDAFLMIDDE